MGRKFNFPLWLQQSDAEREDDERRQELARASFTRAKLTDEERLIASGRREEEAARANLDLLEHHKSRTAQVEHELSRLSLGLSLQGRYKEASEVHPERHMREHYAAIHEAIERDDSETCGCGPDAIRDSSSGQELSVEPFYVQREVYSAKHGRVMPLVACSKCSFLNARPLPEQLANVMHAHAHAASIGKPVRADAEVLK